VEGRTIKQFRVLGKLGEGGMGAVYRARDETLQRDVALKVLPESLGKDEERRRRFLREAQSAAQVTHPNIATIYEVGEADGEVFIAMELVPGGTLRDYIAPGLTHIEAVRVAREIARGLARAHDKGVVHRDLKPENVMVTPDGEVKILDFGLAKFKDGPGGQADATAPTQLTVEGRVLGTPGYMSPEQAEGRRDLDARSDVFSFGAMFYEMLSGRRPFQGTSAIAILYGVLHQEPPAIESLCPELPVEVSSVVARCLRKVRDERYRDGRELAAALGGEITRSGLDAMSRRAPASNPEAPGLGTALGATIASDAAHTSAPRTTVAPVPATRPAPRRGGRLVLAGGGLLAVVAAAAAFFLVEAHRTVAVVASPPLVSSAAHDGGATKHAVVMTDHPPPKTSKREAEAAYAMALSRLRGGGIEPYADLERAALLDPTMAPALLRMTLYAPAFGANVTAAERRTRFLQAEAQKASLEPRDLALLDVADAMSVNPIDWNAAIGKTRALFEHDPTDAELALLLLIYEAKGNDRQKKDVKATAKQLLELDPEATRAYHILAQLAEQQEQYEEATGYVAQCLKANPGASSCQAMRGLLDADQGECAAELATARQLVSLEPDAVRPYGMLAQALDATSAPVGAVRSALDQAEQHYIAGVTKDPPGQKALVLALRVGDFTAADAAAVSLEPAFAGSSSEREHDVLAEIRIAIAEESGNRAKALEIATTFTKEARAFANNAPLGTRLKRVYLMHEAGLLSDAEFQAEREKRFTEMPHAKGTALEREERARLFADAEFAETPKEAKSALGNRSLSELGSPAELHEHAGDLGRLLFLAGRTDEAASTLEPFTRRCNTIPSVLSLDIAKVKVVTDHIHAQLFLGQALEAKAEKAKACAAYSVVASRWKEAKPRSVSLEKATERIRALGCAQKDKR
jgi:serine/threonine-protein kinase